MTFLFAILIFSFLVFVHEFGHFFTAKLFGVQVNEFSIFMGPAIWKKQIGETQYSIRCIPFGGYCAMEGEDEEVDNPRAFGKAAWWKRGIILVAGAAMNFITGFLFLLVLYATLTASVPTVDTLYDGSTLAQSGGLMAGDSILAINGQKIDSVTDFSDYLALDENVTEYDILVSRNGEEILLKGVRAVKQNFPVRDENGEETEETEFYGYGIRWKQERMNLSLGQIIRYSGEDCVNFVRGTWQGLGMLLSGQAGLEDISGPVGLVQQMGATAGAADSSSQALRYLLTFGAIIAVNLCVMNLLPIPAIDGGRIVALLLTTAIEAITKKKINPKYEGYIHAAGMLLLLGLMVVVMFKDILFIFI